PVPYGSSSWFGVQRSTAEMPSQPAFDALDRDPQYLDHAEIDQCCPDVGLEIEGAGISAPRLAHKVVDRDDGDDGRTLNQQNQLIAVGAQRHQKRLREDDLAQRRQAGETESCCR